MLDYDVIIVGGGPAGLTAGIYLGRAKYRVLLLEKEQFGGQLKNVERIENYPGFAEGIGGPQLAAAMVDQAIRCGVELEQGEVTGIESFTSCRSVFCANGKSFTSLAIILAGGSHSKPLAVPGEQAFQRKGIIHCALCDGGQFADGVVAVCGGGDAGVTEALYLTKLASRVIIIEALPGLTATAVLQKRARANPKIEIRCGERVREIKGGQSVGEIVVTHHETGKEQSLAVDGVLVHVGIEPNTEYLDGTVPLDERGQILVGSQLETELSYVYAAGDIRAGSPWQVASAVGDGATAAIALQRMLQMSDAR
ncbi:MAG TPA: FAD-dependent oxidoreductase [Syntrophorhabdaceae bacterium]|nr:FAD-dependent oxidoreductase [Syntrophorhabdaceae bacterium]